MKTKTLKSLLVPFILLATSMPVYADRGDRDDRNNDYAYYIMSPKNWHKGKSGGGDKLLRVIGKSGETRSVTFKGSVQVPDTVKVNAGLLREGPSVVYLMFDDIQCKYETRVTRKFFNFVYPFTSCSDGSRPKDSIRVESKISLHLKETKGFPASAYASIKVLETFVKGIALPQLEADKGQILRFDGELWVPTDYIPDGQAAGDVLVWDGSGWSASKITSSTGSQGEKGDKGDKGDQGPQGIQGERGAVGLTGPAGPQGAVGATGATGATGPIGLTGPAGPKGDQGEKGADGNPGLVSLTAGNGIVGGTILGNGGTIAVNTGTAAGQIPVIGSNGRLAASIIPQSKTVFIKDIKPNGTHGGSCDPTKGWEQIRDLNTISGDSSFVTLAQNQFTLPAGTYEFDVTAPAYLDGFHKALLANATTGEVFIVGSNTRSHNISGGMDPSRIVGILTIAEPTTFVIKHRCATLMNTFGFGVASSFGVDEVYTQVKITKEK